MDGLSEKMALRLLESDEGWADILMPRGSARQASWSAEDGWIIHYTTERVTGGKYAGKFVTLAYRPTGAGSRTGNAGEWRLVYERAFTTRKAAKSRALALYRQHSPVWDARYPAER